MAQTTGAVSGRNCYIAISTDGSTWTDISGFANSVEPDGGERSTGMFHTADGDTPIVTVGKRESVKLDVKTAYTEGGSDPFEVVRAAYEGATSLYVRYAPKGNAAGNFMFTSAAGFVTNAPYPKIVNVEGGKAVLLEFTLETPSVAKSVIT